MAKGTNHADSSDTKRAVPWRVLIGIVFLVLIIAFLAENTAKVSIRFVGPRVSAPLIIALLIAAVLGSVATLALQRHRR